MRWMGIGDSNQEPPAVRREEQVTGRGGMGRRKECRRRRITLLSMLNSSIMPKAVADAFCPPIRISIDISLH
jgi:hypothetical protein